MKTFIGLAGAMLAATASAQTVQPAPSATKLALGADIAAKVLPNGTYQRIMGGMMPNLMKTFTHQMTTMPLAPFLHAAGVSAGDTSKLGEATIQQIMDIVDPAYQRRMDITMPLMMTEMGKIMTQVEPAMRDGLAHAYAARFSETQLQDIDRFMNTPSGEAFAAQNMTIASDPAVMQTMQGFMPKLIDAMPAIMGKVAAATAGLPKPRTAQTLTAAERAKLAALLGTPVVTASHSPAPVSGGSVTMSPNRQATPIGDVGQFFSADRYPPAALRAESQGRVVAMVSVGADGVPTACAIQASSGSGILDSSTCNIAMMNMRFEPATDGKARAVAGSYGLSTVWRIPRDAAMPMPASPLLAPQAN